DSSNCNDIVDEDSSVVVVVVDNVNLNQATTIKAKNHRSIIHLNFIFNEEVNKYKCKVQNHGKQSALVAHFLKKHKVSHDDELETFLNSPTINFDSDALTFWKVMNQRYNIYLGIRWIFIKIFKIIVTSV
ncbi:MAG: hypothetical protein QOK71_11600, partial [Nitrososphaeraceae archaeon]|nr:hypothetical protein [Nitrososphaeraceae archaeon]